MNNKNTYQRNVPIDYSRHEVIGRHSGYSTVSPNAPDADQSQMHVNYTPSQSSGSFGSFGSSGSFRSFGSFGGSEFERTDLISQRSALDRIGTRVRSDQLRSDQLRSDQLRSNQLRSDENKVTYRQGGTVNPYEPEIEDTYSYAKLPDYVRPPAMDRNPPNWINDRRSMISKLDSNFEDYVQRNLQATPIDAQPNSELKTVEKKDNDPSMSNSFADDPSMSNSFAGDPETTDDPRVRLEKSIFGDVQMAGMAYPHVFTNSPFLQPPQSNLILNPKPHYLAIGSADRDRSKDPNVSKYTIPLVGSDNETVCTPGTEYRNIYSFELVNATIPNINNVLCEPHLLFQIEEIQDTYDSSNLNCAKSFVKLTFDEKVGKWLRLDRNFGEPYIKYFYPKPLASLQKLTISIRKLDGTLFNFGADNKPPKAPKPLIQNFFTFKIIEYIPDSVQAIGQRNI
jgi:hypothetical protein